MMPASLALETTMLIECKVRRVRTITIGGDAYTFQPDDQQRFVSEVTKEPHIARFLEIPEYRAVPTEDETVSLTGAAITSTGEGNVITPNEDGNGDDNETHGTDTDTETGNDTSGEQNPDDSSADAGGDGDNEGDTDGELAPVALEDMDADGLTSEYLEAFGTTPHHKMKRETIVAKLKAHYEAEAE